MATLRQPTECGTSLQAMPLASSSPMKTSISQPPLHLECPNSHSGHGPRIIQSHPNQSPRLKSQNPVVPLPWHEAHAKVEMPHKTTLDVVHTSDAIQSHSSHVKSEQSQTASHCSGAWFDMPVILMFSHVLSLPISCEAVRSTQRAATT